MSRDGGQGPDGHVVQRFTATDRQRRCGNGPLAETRASPVDPQAVTSAVVEVGNHQRVGSGRQVDGPGFLDHAVQAVVVDNQFFSDIDPGAVIRIGKEDVTA